MEETEKKVGGGRLFRIKTTVKMRKSKGKPRHFFSFYRLENMRHSS